MKTNIIVQGWKRDPSDTPMTQEKAEFIVLKDSSGWRSRETNKEML